MRECVFVFQVVEIKRGLEVGVVNEMQLMRKAVPFVAYIFILQNYN